MASKVFFATCYPWTGPGAAFHESLIRQLYVDFGERKLLFGGGHLALISGPRIASARNQMVKAFLEFPTKPEYLWLVDSDMSWSPRVLYDLVDCAEANDLPILGGLCFGGGVAGSVFPTLYRMVPSSEHPEGSPVEVIYDYPKDSLIKVDATGAACLLIRRDVLERMFEAHGKIQISDDVWVDNAAPWFAESLYKGHEFSEDWTWCMRAQMLGYPIHVHTGIGMGHQKTQIIDEDVFDGWMVEHKQIGSAGQREKYLRQSGQLVSKTEKPADLWAIVPVKGQYELTRNIIRQLRNQGCQHIIVCDNDPDGDERTRKHLLRQEEHGIITLLDCPGDGITTMWRKGLDVVQADRADVAIVNNDIGLGEDCLHRMQMALRADKTLWAVSANYDNRRIPKGVAYVKSTFKNQGLAGFCYMLKLEPFRQRLLAFDENLRWWFSDDQLVRDIYAAGYKVGLVEQAHVEHLGGGSQTAQLEGLVSLDNPVLKADAEYYREKNGLSWDSSEGW